MKLEGNFIKLERQKKAERTIRDIANKDFAWSVSMAVEINGLLKKNGQILMKFIDENEI